MKRSQINAILRDADEFIRSRGFYLPPFAYWTPEEWAEKGTEASEIVATRLGWDITDFGEGDYERCGLFLFTLRNGRPRNWRTMTGKLYAEKIMVVGDGQVTPLHFHWNKMEDIINRGGGNLVVQLYNSNPEEGLDLSGDVYTALDGVSGHVAAGGELRLGPGESIALRPGCYHKLWGEGRVLVGEVSMVNDDRQDNRFYETVGRFPEIEEDESPLRLLCSDYDRYYTAGED